MPYQSAVTVVAPLPPDRRESATAALADVAGPARGALALDRHPEVHFARLVLVEAETDPAGHPVEPRLVYTADIDGAPSTHLQSMAETAGEGLDRVFSCSPDYPARPDPATRRAWLEEHRVPEAAFYVNTVGRGAPQVLAEAQLRRGLETYLDDHRDDVADLPAAQVHAALRRHALADPLLRFAVAPARRPPLWWRARELAHLVGVAVPVLLLSPILLLVLPLLAVVLLVHELRDVPDRRRPDPATVERLRASEDQVAHNPFTVVGFLKPGPFRAGLTRVVLFAISYAVRHYFNRGSLSGVKTIHFARWVYLAPDRMTFMSTYDGSLESYMDDFIDKVAWGLNAIFSNGIGYPRTLLLFWRGARDEEPFKDNLRNHQLVNQVWYSAYDQITALNVASNAALRQGLARRRMSDCEAREWLALL